MTLRSNKSFEQVLHDMTTQVGVVTGAVRQVFTPEGKAIKSLAGFEDKGKYICCGAEKLNREQSRINHTYSQLHVQCH